MMSNVGYIRVSTIDQNTVRQLDNIKLDKVFKEHKSGKDSSNREQLNELLDYVREGDIVHVHSIDRLARNLTDLKEIVNKLKVKRVAIKFHKENLLFSTDETEAISQLLFNILGSFSEFERELMLERQREGIAIAKKAGKYQGRKKTINNEAIREAMKQEGASFRKVAKQLNISLSTVQRAMKIVG